MNIKTNYDFRLLDSDEVDILYQNQKLSQCFKSFPDGTKKPVGETTLEEIGNHYNSDGEYLSLDLELGEMKKTVTYLKESGKDSIRIGIADMLELVIEILADCDGDTLSLSVSLTDLDNLPVETAQCSYNAEESELDAILDYIRVCILDELEKRLNEHVDKEEFSS